jgi:hypothetical protein
VTIHGSWGGHSPIGLVRAGQLRRDHSSMHFFPFALRWAKLAFVASSKTLRTFSWKGVGGRGKERRWVREGRRRMADKENRNHKRKAGVGNMKH